MSKVKFSGEFDWRGVVEFCASHILSLGMTTIINKYTDKWTEDCTKMQKLGVKAVTYVGSDMATTAMTKHVMGTYDEIAQDVKDIRKEFAEIRAELKKEHEEWDEEIEEVIDGKEDE